MSTKQKMGLIIRAMNLIKQKPNAVTALARMKWTNEAVALLGLFIPKPKVEPSIESHPGYQYLQSVINSEIPNMNDPEIGVRMTEILNQNSENPAFISYVQQAVATYRNAMLTASKQYLWGRA